MAPGTPSVPKMTAANNEDFEGRQLSMLLAEAERELLKETEAKKTVSIPLHQKPQISIVDTVEIMKSTKTYNVATLELGPLEGFLWKQGESNMVKSWKHRLFRLEDQNLCYYCTEKPQHVLKGQIPINKITNVLPGMKFARKGYGFQICTPGRDYNIVAESEAQMIQWVNRLRMAMKGEATIITPRQRSDSQEKGTGTPKQRRSNEETTTSTSEENLHGLSVEDLISKIRLLESELKKAREELAEKDQEIQQLLRTRTSTK